MRLARVQIENFRNFRRLDVRLAEEAVIVGENQIGKTNFLHALRLVLDPSLPDLARHLRIEDFWDGLPRPIPPEEVIRISLDLDGFEPNDAHVALLCDSIIQPEPMVSRLTYEFGPRQSLKSAPVRAADYEWRIYGGDRPEVPVRSEVRRRLPIDVLPALRDAESALGSWRSSPLRPLLEDVAATIDAVELSALAERFTALSAEFASGLELQRLSQLISERLLRMVGPSHGLALQLGLSPSDPDRLLRSLRLFIDGGTRSVGEASLGSANLLFLTLKQLELEQMVEHGERDHTFLAIEEPEAHLHPHVQRLVYRDFLRTRSHLGGAQSDSGSGAPHARSSGEGGTEPGSGALTKLMTTHSPHIVSVAPVRSLVHLRRSRRDGSTIAASTSNLTLAEDEVEDLERYLEVTRGEIVFARGVLLVEGEAELYLLPAIGRKLGFDFDELGITVCSIAGTHFTPYLKFLGPRGLDLPHAIVTDGDPDEEGISQGRVRVFRLFPLTVADGAPEPRWPEPAEVEFPSIAAERGLFVNDHTLEVDLFRSGQHGSMMRVLEELTSNAACRERARNWAEDPGAMTPQHLLRDIGQVGKGRFAQRLASCLTGRSCPQYVENAIRHVARLCGGPAA